MKIFFSIDRNGVTRDIESLEGSSAIHLSKSDILNGIGYSSIAILFDYWKQESLIVNDSLLSFHYNLITNVDKLVSGEIKEAHSFSVEEGFSMKFIIQNNNLLISSFGEDFLVDSNEFREALYKSFLDACEILEGAYLGLSDNTNYKEIRRDIKSD